MTETKTRAELIAGNAYPHLKDGYQGPKGTVAMIHDTEIKEEFLVFIKNTIIIGIGDSDNLFIPETFDCIVYNPDLLAPDSLLSREHVDAEHDLVRKKHFQ